MVQYIVRYIAVQCGGELYGTQRCGTVTEGVVRCHTVMMVQFGVVLKGTV